MAGRVASTKSILGKYKGAAAGLVLVLTLLPGQFPAMAQLTTGTVSGTVTDQSGAAVPGAAITVKNTGTGIARGLVTNPLGRYEAPNLPVGSYEISASLTGFQTSIRTGIELTVGRHAVVDVVLQVGEVSQAVTVSGEATLVETSTATVSNLVDEKRVADLPLNNRDLTQLTFLQPGVLRVPQVGEQNPIGGMGEKISVAGTRGTQNLYLLDGVSNGDHSGNPQGASSAYIGAETVKEFQIIMNNYSAEYRSAAGAIVSAVTRSGTNSFHGSLFEFLRNDNLDAANFFDNAFGNPKPEFKRNQLGGSLGGPLVRDRTFFFGSYEGLRERLGTTDSARVPTVAARQGQLPGGTVPVSPVARPYLELYPVPGQNNSIISDLRDGTALIAGTRTQPTTDDFVALRMDHQFSAQKAGFLSGTYNFDDGERSPFGVLGDVLAQGSASSRHVVSVRHTSVVSPTVLNEFSFGFSLTSPQGQIPLGKRDFQNVLFVPSRKVMGQLNVGDLSSIGYRNGARNFRQKSIALKEGLSLIRGNHSFRMGAELDRFRYDYVIDGQGFAGVYDFRSLQTFLAGTPLRFQAQLPGGNDPNHNLTQLLFGTYFQDNYTVRPSLTLNLGLRYEFATVPHEVNGKISTLLHFTDTDVTVGKFFTNATLKSFSPRFGFAWAPGRRKSSVRGGVGIFYEHPMLYHIQTSVSSLPPFNLLGDARDTDAIRAGTTLVFPNAYTRQEQLLRGQPSIRSMEYDQKTMYTYRWSLTLQQELAGEWILTAGYVGSRSLHLWQQSVTNINKWEGWPNNPTGRKFWPAITGTNLINPRFNDIRLQSPNSNSYYEGLTLGAQKRLNYGLQVQLAYSFSNTIDQFSGLTNSGDNLPETQRGIYAWDMQLARGPAAFDIRNNFVANFSYELPLGTNWTGIAGKAGKGWQFNGILTISDGHPLTVFDTVTAQQDRIGNIEALRVDLIPGGNNNPVLGGPVRYYDPSQFAPSQLGYFGTLGRNTLRSPGLAMFDLSLFKNFDLTERSRIQFRAEFFSLLNRVNLGEPDTTPFTTTGRPDANVGRITSTRTPARQIQFGLKFTF